MSDDVKGACVFCCGDVWWSSVCVTALVTRESRVLLVSRLILPIGVLNDTRRNVTTDQTRPGK